MPEKKPRRPDGEHEFVAALGADRPNEAS
jgi:hypothetical protein